MSFMDNYLSEDVKKKKNITDLIDLNINELPKINLNANTKSIIRNIKSMNINNNISLIKFNDKTNKLKNYASKMNKKVKFLSKLDISSNKNKAQKSVLQTNSGEHDSYRNISQFNENTDVMKNIKEKVNDKMILLNKKKNSRNNDIKKNYHRYLTKNLPKVNEYKKKRKFSDLSLKESNVSMYDSGNEIVSNNFFNDNNENFYNDNIINDNLNLRFISHKQKKKRMSKNYYRQMTTSPNKTMHKNNDLDSNIFELKNSYIKQKTYIIEKITLKFDIDEYLKKEREKLSNQISNIQEENLKTFKQSLLDKSLNFIKKKEVKPKLINFDKVSFKDIIYNAYKSLFHKLISSRNVQRIELSLLKYFDLIGFLFFEKQIIQYILEKFFEIYNQTIQNIFNENFDTSKKRKGRRKSDLSMLEIQYNTSIEMIKIIPFNIKTSKDKLFINSLIIKDLYKQNDVEYSEIDRQLVIVLKRKKTRKRRRSSLIAFLNKNNGSQIKKEKYQNLMSIIKDNDKHSKYEILQNKFYQTSTFLDVWNPLLNKNMLDSRSENRKEKKNLKYLLLKNKDFSVNQKWKNDMEILKSLGGNPMSKENSILKYKELKDKAKKNILYFEKLYQLINRGQNELFFEEFNKLMDEIDINYINRRTDYSLLMNAIKNENLSIIEFLIKKGCKINIQNNLGNTPLHIAFMINNPQIINLLISYGANQKILNNRGLTPWECRKKY